jgi:hypothetical protein
MWSRGNNQWVYQLYSPLNMLGDFEYRYCRNDQCGIADDGQTSAGQHGRPVSTSLVPQDLQDTISGWTWLKDTTTPAIVGLPVTARQGFMAGVEFQPDYDPTWQAWTPLALQNVKSLYANWVVLDPSWTVSQTAPFIFSPLPGLDPLWADTIDTASRARASNLKVALFPEANLPTNLTAWWTSTPRDATWWNNWFELLPPPMLTWRPNPAPRPLSLEGTGSLQLCRVHKLTGAIRGSQRMQRCAGKRS